MMLGDEPDVRCRRLRKDEQNAYSYLDEPIKTPYSKQKCLFAFLALFCCMLILHFYYDQELLLDGNLRIFTFHKKSNDSDKASQIQHQNDFLIDQKGCRIPAMYAFGPLVDPYIEKAAAIQCDIRVEKPSNSSNTAKPPKIWKPALFHDVNNTLNVDHAALKYYGEKNLSCEYEEFFRAKPSNDDETYLDGDVIYKGKKKKVHFNKPTIILQNTEFIRVLCHKTGKQNGKIQEPIYKDFFAFVPMKEEVEKRCSEKANQSDNNINVIIVALDALSRLNFHRQMMMSYHFLENEMHGIEMLGYNKVGDNTFPNFIPMFSGQSVEELKNTCWHSDNSFFDECAFIWRHFEEFGYRTNFAEESGNIGVFNYMKRGFRQQPTDYYLRPFNIQAESEIGHTKPGNCFLCIGSKLNLDFLLDYATKFMEKFVNKKFFGLFWSSSFTHDYFNLSPLGDNAVLKFLRHVHGNNLLNNTVLILVSDHGLRWGSFRETFQGHLEERLPMLWFVFPHWFRTRYQSAIRNLRANIDKLTTPFDLYETLHDFANLTRIEDTEIESRQRDFVRQTSLFLAISANRTCADAAIPKHYCTCHNNVESLNVHDAVVTEAAYAVIDRVNEMLKNHRQCSRLNLHTIEDASIERIDKYEKIANQSESSYVIIVKTTPGGGVFEASVKYKAVERVFLVIGSVSRINTYGSQGNCINDYVLRLYCYCK